MKTYKIDPLGKKRPLMLVRGTRLPEVFPDSIAENLVNSLAENSRGLVVGINGQVTPTKIVGDLVFSNSGSNDQSAVAMIVESWGSQQGVTWEDRIGQEYKLECNSVPKGELFGGTNPYYTGPYKDLKQFVRNVIPYTGQPLTTSNCRQWFSYTTEDGVALTFRGCIQAQKQGGEYAGLKIDKIELGQETTDGHIVDIDEDLCITLDCDSPVVLGMPNGMKGSVPLPYFPGIGWLQIVATDEFKSHLQDFNESDGNGDAAERQWSGTNYDGFTYNIILSGIFTDPHQFRKPNNAASCRVKVKENSQLCNSTIGNADGYAVEYFGVSMVNPIKEGIYADVSPVLDGEVKTVDLPAYGNKYMVIRVPNVSSADEVLHVNIPAPSTNKMFSAITFVTMNGRKVAENELTVGDNAIILPEMPDMFAFFNISNMSAGTISVTISRATEQSEPSEPVRTPGFYSADGQLIKAMTKEEVETDYRFSNCPSATNESVKNATEFVWPGGVTKVGNNVFNDCTSLASVSIPESVTSIGETSFRGCSSLTSVTIPEGVTSIGSQAFLGCSALTSVTIPESVTSICDHTFYKCSRLTSVTIPSTVTSIGQYAFSGCSRLTSITIPESVTTIGNYAFDRCSGLTSVTIPEGVTKIGEGAFSACSRLTSVTIPSKVTSIDKSAFWGCSGLTSVTIPEGVTSIGSQAFINCTGLNPLTVPNTVTTIGNNAFKNVPKVIYGGTATGSPWGALEVVAPQKTPGFYSADGQLIKAMTKEEVETDYSSINCPTKVDESLVNATEFVWPEGVTKVGNFVFADCSGLTSVAIPEGVTSIGTSAFYGCSGLTSVTIPSTVTSVGVNAFSDCSSLTSVTIPEGVTSIGNSAFYGCSGLTSVTIPSTVASIGDSAFRDCSGLTSVTIPEGVTSIGISAFYGCSGLTEVVIPSTVTSIGRHAFNGCSGLTSVAIPEGVTSIDNYTFKNCSNLTSVAIPSSVTTIGNNAFNNCTALNPLMVPNTVTTIGQDAFQNVPKVIYNGSAEGSPWGATEVSTGGSTPNPGPNPEPDPEPTRDPGFYNAEGQLIKAFTKEDVETDYTISTNPAKVDETLQTATEFVWPAGVTRVGNYAFRKCKGLTSVTIPEGVTSIGKSSFSMCSGLTSLTIDGGITAIGESVFDGCTHLNTVVLPNTLESIGLSSFQGCSALTTINIPDSVTSLNNNAFSSCTSLNPLTVPSTVTTIGVNAFNHVPKVIYNGPATGSPWGAVEIAAS